MYAPAGRVMIAPAIVSSRRGAGEASIAIAVDGASSSSASAAFRNGTVRREPTAEGYPARMDRARELIETLKLSPHPERGFFAETYRAARTRDARSDSTAIYFLLTRDQPFTFLHRLKSDELFH